MEFTKKSVMRDKLETAEEVAAAMVVPQFRVGQIVVPVAETASDGSGYKVGVPTRIVSVYGSTFKGFRANAKNQRYIGSAAPLSKVRAADENEVEEYFEMILERADDMGTLDCQQYLASF